MPPLSSAAPPDAFYPSATPEALLAYVRQLEARILAVGPELEPPEIRELLGELAITHLKLDRVVRWIQTRSDWQLRASLPPASELERPPIGAPLWALGAAARLDRRPAWSRSSGASRRSPSATTPAAARSSSGSGPASSRKCAGSRERRSSEA